MNANEIRAAYLKFFQARGHAVIPSSKLIPENDPTTLFTGSGMQPLVPYLLGEEHPEGVRLTDSQKCFRAQDIDEVGDNRHTTFFEMLGNWSLGDYFKAEQLPWFFEFLTDVVGLDPQRLYVTAYAGDPDNALPRDEEAAGIWKELFAKKGIAAETADMITEEGGAVRGMKPGERIFFYREKNWWCRQGNPAKMPVGEPGGPDSEVFFEFSDIPHDARFGANCHPNCDCGRFLEIGNSVFMEYKKAENGFEKLAKQNVDFGGGLERIAGAKLGDPDMFKVSLLWPLIEQVQAASGKEYAGNEAAFRVVADHIRAATFLIADGVRPSNVDRGYALRRLIRRAVRYADTLGVADALLGAASRTVVASYKDTYPVLAELESEIVEVIGGEEQKFRRTLSQGGKELAQLASSKGEGITGEDLLTIHASYGYPFDLSIEELRSSLKLDEERLRDEFDKAMTGHREKSRAGAEKKFGGHGMYDENGDIRTSSPEEYEKVSRLHTATHMIQSALREVLGPEVRQAGSDITAERTRFDFTFDRKLTDEELKRVEDLVNEKIAEDLPMEMFEMPREEAAKTGALTVMNAKYGDTVRVWRIGYDWDDAFSKEFCGGPHVKRTGEIGRIRIAKQEAVAAGIRRVRAVIA